MAGEGGRIVRKQIGMVSECGWKKSRPLWHESGGGMGRPRQGSGHMVRSGKFWQKPAVQHGSRGGKFGRDVGTEVYTVQLRRRNQLAAARLRAIIARRRWFTKLTKTVTNELVESRD